MPLKQMLEINTECMTNDQLRTIIRTIVMGPGNYFGNDDLLLTIASLKQLYKTCEINCKLNFATKLILVCMITCNNI